MSSGEPIPYDEASEVAYSFTQHIDDCATRIAIAGSLRRNKSEVHDIEIVVKPKFLPLQNTLDGTLGSDALNSLHARLTIMFQRGKINRNRPRKDDKSNPFGERYYRINYLFNGEEYPIDLFSVIPPAQWGVIFLIRTGSADYSHWFVQQGYKYGIKVVNGHLEHNGEVLNTPEEEDVFKAMHVEHVKPENR